MLSPSKYKTVFNLGKIAYGYNTRKVNAVKLTVKLTYKDQVNTSTHGIKINGYWCLSCYYTIYNSRNVASENQINLFNLSSINLDISEEIKGLILYCQEYNFNDAIALTTEKKSFLKNNPESNLNQDLFVKLIPDSIKIAIIQLIQQNNRK